MAVVDEGNTSANKKRRPVARAVGPGLPTLEGCSKSPSFTARVRNDLDDGQRQSDYLDALADHSPLVTVMNGRFQALAISTGTPGGAELFGDPRAGVPLPVGFLWSHGQFVYPGIDLPSSAS